MKQNLNEVLLNNKKWPILLKNVNAKEILNTVIISADISNSELAVLPSENGMETPKWLKELQIKAKLTENVVLIIDKIDSVYFGEQEKFYGMLKFKALNGFDLPLNSQICLTCSDTEKVSRKIKDLCIIY